MPRITHVVFDLDGTLLDTEPAYFAVNDGIARRFGETYRPEVRAQMVGRPGPVAARIFVERLGIPLTPEAFTAERDARLVEHFLACEPMPGARALSAHLRAHGVPQAIATSAARSTLAVHRSGRHAAWLDTFDALVTAEDVAHGKPAPDIFLRAAALLGAPAETTLVFEDAPLGVEAALAAGMWVVATPEAAHREGVAGAHEVLESLEQFDPAAWGLPPFASEPGG